jgi:hypothetical protein
MVLMLEPTTASTLEDLPIIHEKRADHPDALDSIERVLFNCAWRLTTTDIPVETTLEAPSTARRLRDIATYTGWSNRTLAEILGTTHPTIAAVLSGRDTSRVVNLRDRIARVHSAIERLALLSRRDIAEVRRLLETKPDGRSSAAELMKSGAFSQAYLTALDVRRPQVDEGLMGAALPARRRGTVSLEGLDE